MGIIDYAKRNGIAVGPGRDWQPSSLVAYILGITEIDPLCYGLFFEMWLNPERVTVPSIEVDVACNHRDELLRYLRRKYGEHSVSPVRFSNWPHFPSSAPNLACAEALPKNGQAPEAKVDPSGVAISIGRLADIVPMTVDEQGHSMTQHARFLMETLGCLVLDLHPHKILAVNQSVLTLVREVKGVDISLNHLSLGDRNTYKMLGQGHILGVLPVDSSLAANTCRRIKPSRIQDIAALVAFSALGSEDYIALYAARKRQESPISYEHHLLEPILRETYGIMVYREQYVQALELLAGYTRGRADLLRRAIPKKHPLLLMANYLPAFVKDCARSSNIPEHAAIHLFNYLNIGAGHCFPKSYAVSSSLLAYQTAYLKAHYPLEFYSALLEHHCDAPEYVFRIKEEMASFSWRTM